MHPLHRDASGTPWWVSSPSLNRKVGRGVLTPPPDVLDLTVGRGAVRTPRPTQSVAIRAVHGTPDGLVISKTPWSYLEE